MVFTSFSQRGRVVQQRIIPLRTSSNTWPVSKYYIVMTIVFARGVPRPIFRGWWWRLKVQTQSLHIINIIISVNCLLYVIKECRLHIICVSSYYWRFTWQILFVENNPFYDNFFNINKLVCIQILFGTLASFFWASRTCIIRQCNVRFRNHSHSF